MSVNVSKGQAPPDKLKDAMVLNFSGPNMFSVQVAGGECTCIDPNLGMHTYADGVNTPPMPASEGMYYFMPQEPGWRLNEVFVQAAHFRADFSHDGRSIEISIYVSEGGEDDPGS